MCYDRILHLFPRQNAAANLAHASSHDAKAVTLPYSYETLYVSDIRWKWEWLEDGQMQLSENNILDFLLIPPACIKP